MKRNLILAAVILIGMAGALVLAQSHAPGGAMGDNMKGMAGMMDKMSPQMKMRCQMMMDTAVTPADPAAILALKDQLKLTETQTAQLKAINKEAQDKAVAVLTADQKTTLDALPASPETMMDMHEQMMGKMRKVMGGNKEMSCPMMNMMRGHMGPTTQPHVDAPAGHDHEAHQ
jgi:hypothetical protein